MDNITPRTLGTDPLGGPIHFTVDVIEHEEENVDGTPSYRLTLPYEQYIQPTIDDDYPLYSGGKNFFLVHFDVTGSPSPFDAHGNLMKPLRRAALKRYTSGEIKGAIEYKDEHGTITIKW